MAYNSCWTVSSAVLPSYIFYIYSAKSPYSLHGTKPLLGSKQMMYYWINSPHFMESWTRKKIFLYNPLQHYPNSYVLCLLVCICACIHKCARVFSDTFRITHHVASNDRVTHEWWIGKVHERKRYMTWSQRRRLRVASGATAPGPALSIKKTLSTNRKKLYE